MKQISTDILNGYGFLSGLSIRRLKDLLEAQVSIGIEDEQAYGFSAGKLCFDAIDKLTPNGLPERAQERFTRYRVSVPVKLVGSRNAGGCAPRPACVDTGLGVHCIVEPVMQRPQVAVQVITFRVLSLLS